MHYIQIFKLITPPLIFNFFKNIYNVIPKYFGLNQLDKRIEKYLNYDSGFFVELGANDGKSQSNTLYFEKYRKWNGVLIEPTPNKYLECINNRSKNAKIFCNACVSFEYKDKYVDILYSNLMTTTIGLETDIEDPINHANYGKVFLKNNEVQFSFGATAITLNEILISSNAPKIIDLLSLDVEGVELEVLKGIDYSKYNFKYICIETRDFEKINNFLTNINYKFVEKLTHHDFIFKYTK
jgi:FkbM family methyltransferase